MSHHTVARILVVDRDVAVREQLQQILTLAGYAVDVAIDASAAAASGPADVIVLELAACAGSAVRLAGAGRVIAGVAPHESVATALRAGAAACTRRPYEADEVLALCAREVELARASRELTSLRALLDVGADASLVGRSVAMRRMRELIVRAAATDALAILLGEQGSGRELAARTLHALSRRARGPFVTVDCTGLDETSLAAELFGPAGGTARGGLLYAAHTGTLLLKGLPALPAPIAMRIAVAGADARLVLAHQDAAHGNAPASAAPWLRATPITGRAATNTIVIPPLRERLGDIPLLVAHFRDRTSRSTGIATEPLPAETLRRLMGYDWPGNVRQLEQWVEWTGILPGAARFPWEQAAQVAMRDPMREATTTAARDAQWTLEQLERAYIRETLDSEGGHQSRAAARLGIDRRTLYRKLKQYRAEDRAAERARVATSIPSVQPARGTVRTA